MFVVGLSAARGAAGRSFEPLVALVSVLASMIYALQNVSACFNPAVTLAGMTTSLYRKMHGEDGLILVLVQIVAGVLGGFAYSFVQHGHAIPLAWGQGFGWLAITIAE